MRTIGLVALVLLLLSPTAAAQAFDGISIAPEGDDVGVVIAPDGSATIPYTITIGCGEFIAQGTQSLTATLTAEVPAYYTVTSQDVTFSAGAGCANPDGEMTGTANLVLTPTTDAIGRDPQPWTTTVTAGDASATFEHESNIQVDYAPGHTITPSIQFPYNFTAADEGAVEFSLDIQITANSRTMVMFERVSTAGGIDGLFHQIFDVEQGERSRTLNITWTPPSGSWDNATISFYNYSHCLKGSPCPNEVEQNVTWTIVNTVANSGNGGGGSKDTPSLPVLPVILVLVVVAAAFVAYRRR